MLHRFTSLISSSHSDSGRTLHLTKGVKITFVRTKLFTVLCKCWVGLLHSWKCIFPCLITETVTSGNSANQWASKLMMLEVSRDVKTLTPLNACSCSKENLILKYKRLSITPRANCVKIIKANEIIKITESKEFSFITWNNSIVAYIWSSLRTFLTRQIFFFCWVCNSSRYFPKIKIQFIWFA